MFIYITASSPNRASLGTVNGFAQLGVSIMRAVGPAAANSLFSLSIHPDYHYLNGHLVYWAMSLLTIMALIVGSYLPSKVWSADDSEES